MASKQIPDSGISNQKIESDFGSYPTDFIEYYVYDSDDNFIVSKIKKSGAKSDLVDINPGKDLRECGVIAGKDKVTYKFLSIIKIILYGRFKKKNIRNSL